MTLCMQTKETIHNNKLWKRKYLSYVFYNIYLKFEKWKIKMLREMFTHISAIQSYKRDFTINHSLNFADIHLILSNIIWKN
ncbi:hypothetical protein V1477_013649 [Vespula maculifrons]|uniref:Uncharacterized protein n=1 Tax=Vespula maculifrons TaxID=7453 RepID=A0ABD2BNX1_VESMC